MEQKNGIICGNCGKPVQVEQAIEERLKRELNEKVKAYQDKVRAQELAVQEREAALERDKKQQDQLIAVKLEAEKQLLQVELRKQAAAQQQLQEKQYQERLKQELLDKEAEIIRRTNEQNEARLRSLTEENADRKAQMQKMQDTVLEFERAKRRHEEELRNQALKYEQQQSELRRQLEEQISQQVHEQNELKLREKDMQMQQLRQQIDEMKRKAEQGSMQLQGEVQELALEDLLRSTFPKDEISGVGKGVRGADIVQVVRNNEWQDCGKILYESKRTKHFSQEWLTKLKADRALVKADICVIVTEALPEGIDKIGLKEDVWICSYHDVKGLTMSLRETLICCHQLTASQSNRGDKMQLLYDFLTGNEFRMQLMSILEGFNALQDQLIKERRVMNAQWAEREKQLEKVLLNTQRFYGSIRGIAGNAIAAITTLEPESLLPQPEEETITQELPV